jgi:beta-phosphoglucomutase family hydrolase
MPHKTFPFKGVIFDLDGVITSTTRQHKEAWRWMFTTVAGIDSFTDSDYKTYVDGKPRIDGIRSFLAHKGVEVDNDKLAELAEQKQQHFLQLIATEGVDVFEETKQYVYDLAHKNIKLAVASSSKNTPLILKRIGMIAMFEVIVANDTVYLKGKHEPIKIQDMQGKPAPDIFITAARYLQLDPSEVVGIEDAVAGVQAIKAAGIKSVAICRQRKERAMLEATEPDVLVTDLREISVDELGEIFLMQQAKMKPNSGN